MSLELNLLKYWKNSLADAARSTIQVTPKNAYQAQQDILNVGRIETALSRQIFEKEERKLNDGLGIKSPESEHWKKLETVPLLISIFKVIPRPEYLQFYGNDKTLYPFWLPATVLPTGELRVPDEYFPLIPREFLSPLGDEQPDYIFSTVDKVDNAASLKRETIDDWKDYKLFIEEVFTSLTGQKLAAFAEDNYSIRWEVTMVVSDEEAVAASAIIQLYENLLKRATLPPLLQRFIGLRNYQADRAPLKVEEFIGSHTGHMGQMGDSYPLSLSQRKSLYTFNKTCNNHPVFAVNGPPGTGKTSLLQSVVANEVVLSAIRGEDAPLILACSANNQAVTNINESFIKADSTHAELRQRWVPDLGGYATYLPKNEMPESELVNLNYIKLKKKDGKDTFLTLETPEYVNRAKDYFVTKANAYLKKKYVQVSEVSAALRAQLQAAQAKLEKGSKLWKGIRTAIGKVSDWFDPPYHDQLLESDFFWIERKTELEQLEHRVGEYFSNEPFIRKLFCFLSFKRWLKARELALRPVFRESHFNVSTVNYRSKAALLEFLQARIDHIIAIRKLLTTWQAWKNDLQIVSNPPHDEEVIWDAEYNALRTGKRQGYFYDELDTSLRHVCFHLAMHYWEGRWIDEMTQRNGSVLRGGESDRKVLWKTRAMLTPCFVSTFYMAPKFFSFSKKIGTRLDNQPIFDNAPLTDFIDLLIVDESGQVSPEIGIAVFALAKKALVVGDVNQIQPVWNSTPKVDLGNLIHHKIAHSHEDERIKEMSDKGFLCSDGSIMKMAQNACVIKDSDSKLKEKGVMLVEHRRCYDEIIAYCNDVAYRGMLKPMKGKSTGELFLPMVLIHHEGRSEVSNKDRYNEPEAEAVKAWLQKNRLKIESHFDKKIEDLVGIITPFKGQKRLLIQKLAATGLATARMKIGTVHALQGAEREIILFSPVYGPGDVSVMFFDRNNKPNMLNVAVSRAKKSFIVIGNELIFDSAARTPSGRLRRYLKKQLN